jgi:trimethylamine--corrinoid protein Co-methyltransferase
MRANYMEYRSPQFHILSDKQIETIYHGALQIMERTGVCFECQEALDILDGAGADVSDPNRVKIPSFLVEDAIRKAPKSVTFYTREGQPAFVLNGMTGCHFGSIPDPRKILDPHTGEYRTTYIEDIADMSRLTDALHNMEWTYTASSNLTLPVLPNMDISDRIALLQFVQNSTKPIINEITNVDAAKEMIEFCSMIAGSEENLRRKPFWGGSCEPVTPLVEGKDAMEKSLLCAEKGLPVVVYSMPMAGATTPATWPAILALSCAEVLSQLVVLQIKRPGTPVIFGSIPNIMEMRTTIFPYGAPELSYLVAALTEICHYHKLPMFGTAGCSDSYSMDAQAAAEVTYQVVLTMLSGADLVHDVGVVYHNPISPELLVFVDEIIEMSKVFMGGIEINDDTLPLDLIDKVGPKGSYLMEKHTLKHFRRFWAPTIFDRSTSRTPETKGCAELLRDKTINLIKTHKPKPLPTDIAKEVKKYEALWLKRVGLKEYPKRPV